MLGVQMRRAAAPVGRATVRLPASEAVWVRSVRTDPVAVSLASAGTEVDVSLLHSSVGAAPEWAAVADGDEPFGVRLALAYRQGVGTLCSAEVWLPDAAVVPEHPLRWPLRRWEQPHMVVDELRTRMPSREECAEFLLSSNVPVLELERTGVTLTGRVTDQMRLVLPADRITLGYGALRRRRVMSAR